MNLIEQYEINGKMVFMEQTYSIVNLDKQKKVMALLDDQENLSVIHYEDDLFIYSSGNKDYIAIDGRTNGADVLVSIKNVPKQIKKGLDDIFNDKTIETPKIIIKNEVGELDSAGNLNINGKIIPPRN